MPRRHFPDLPVSAELPAGTSCADCQFFVGCTHIAVVSPGTKVCHWGRSRFTPRQAQAELPELVERAAVDLQRRAEVAP